MLRAQKETLKYYKSNEKKHSISELWQINLMITPQLIGFLVFGLYPLLWVIRFAWYDYDGINMTFVGWDNFIRGFTSDPIFWKSILNTFLLSAGKLVVELPLALILALALKSSLKGKSFYRAVFFMPNIISVAIIGVVYYFLFASFEGIVNNILIMVNVIDSPINWFGNKWTSMLVVAIASIWQSFGINMLFFLAGLTAIPKELYESAEIDGASKFKQFTHVTIPMLAPVMQIVCMLAIIGSLKVTDLVLVLTNGQPAGETEVVMTYLFKLFFQYGTANSAKQIGYGCALGIITSVIIGILTIIYLKYTKSSKDISS